MTTDEVNPHSLVSEGISEFAGVGIHRLAEQVGRTRSSRTTVPLSRRGSRRSSPLSPHVSS